MHYHSIFIAPDAVVRVWGIFIKEKIIHPLEGRKQTAEHIRKRIESLKKTLKAHPRADEWHRKQSESHMGQPGYWTGKHRYKKTNKKISDTLKGKYPGAKNPMWRGSKATYFTKHTWLRNNYGKANHCVNPRCSKISQMFNYANISGIHDHNIRHYAQLCASCHQKFDRGSLTYKDIFSI